MHKLTVLAPMATALIALLALAPSAWAVDGVIEINHAKALAGGVTASDTPGYPVTIDRAGSYRLTGNLTVPNQNTHGIKVSANDVGIDLNNFAIIGPVTCSGSPLTCSYASGAGSGIFRASLSTVGTSVKNGSITGMGDYGVALHYLAEVTNLRLRWNRSGGILAFMGSKILGNTVYQNGGLGITAADGSTVSGNVVYQNGTDGMWISGGSTVSGNTARENGGRGFSLADGSTVSGNTAFGNGSDGIRAGRGSTVSGNTAYSNGDDGMEINNDATVSGNTIYGNTGYGINFTIYSGAYSENVISNNTGGTVNGTAVEFGQNVCNGTTTCP